MVSGSTTINEKNMPAPGTGGPASSRKKMRFPHAFTTHRELTFMRHSSGFARVSTKRNRPSPVCAQIMDVLNFLQWPAMVISVIAAWLVGSQSKRRRSHGFWWFLASNALWIAWGIHAHAWALIALQVALAVLNCRNVAKNTPSN